MIVIIVIVFSFDFATILYINSRSACVRDTTVPRFNPPGGTGPEEPGSVRLSVCDHWTQRKVTGKR